MTLSIYNTSTGQWVDITPYIEYGGIKYSKNDIDGPDAGRTLDGTMYRARVAEKHRLDIKCHVAKASDYWLVQSLIRPSQFQVRFEDEPGVVSTWWMYSNNFTKSFFQVMPDGSEFWQEFEFPLIEI